MLMGSITDKIKGKAKQVEGKLTGDKLRQGQGTVQKAKGDVEGTVERTKRRVKARVDEARVKRAMKKR
jgi:uncharacterized protein YjbJ (UPF0337 family)